MKKIRFLCILLSLALALLSMSPARVVAAAKTDRAGGVSDAGKVISEIEITDLDMPVPGSAPDDTATVISLKNGKPDGIKWTIPVIWIDFFGNRVSIVPRDRACYPVFVFYVPKGYVLSGIDLEKGINVRFPGFVTLLYGAAAGMVSVTDPGLGVTYISGKISNVGNPYVVFPYQNSTDQDTGGDEDGGSVNDGGKEYVPESEETDPEKGKEDDPAKEKEDTPEKEEEDPGKGKEENPEKEDPEKEKEDEPEKEDPQKEKEDEPEKEDPQKEKENDPEKGEEDPSKNKEDDPEKGKDDPENGKEDDPEEGKEDPQNGNEDDPEKGKDDPGKGGEKDDDDPQPGEEPGEEEKNVVAIHCSKEAVKALGTDFLKWLVGTIKNTVEPQAVTLLTNSFPSFQAAAEGGELGKETGLYVYFDQSDAALAYYEAKKAEDTVKYRVAVNSSFFANAVYDEKTGQYLLDDDTRSELDNTMTHEMMHAFMYDFTREGMIGSSVNAGGAAQFPMWFAEGVAAMVEDNYRYRLDKFRSLGYENGAYTAGKLADSCNIDDIITGLTSGTAVGTYVSGYLASMYLAGLAATNINRTVQTAGIFDSSAIRLGLDYILSELHVGKTLDDVIASISVRNGVSMYTGTDDFQNKFLNGSDSDSAGFCSGLLNYLDSIGTENYTANGSVLYDFDREYTSPLEGVEPEAGVYRIADTSDPVKSTVKDGNGSETSKITQFPQSSEEVSIAARIGEETTAGFAENEYMERESVPEKAGAEVSEEPPEAAEEETTGENAEAVMNAGAALEESPDEETAETSADNPGKPEYEDESVASGKADGEAESKAPKDLAGEAPAGGAGEELIEAVSEDQAEAVNEEPEEAVSEDSEEQAEPEREEQTGPESREPEEAISKELNGEQEEPAGEGPEEAVSEQQPEAPGEEPEEAVSEKSGESAEPAREEQTQEEPAHEDAADQEKITGDEENEED